MDREEGKSSFLERYQQSIRVKAALSCLRMAWSFRQKVVLLSTASRFAILASTLQTRC